MATKLTKRYVIAAAGWQYPGTLCFWLRHKPESNEIWVKRTRGRARTSYVVARTCFKSTPLEWLH